MKNHQIHREILEAIIACVADPRTVLPQSPGESIRQHVIRAISSMFQPIESSDGSAQPVTPSIQQVQADLMREQRDATNSELAARNLELQLAQGHLREAQRVHTAMKTELDALKDSMRDTDEGNKDMQREIEKARRVIAGNTNIEDSGSLLDMLNAILQRLAFAEDAASKGEKARLAAGGMEEEITRLREKEALHTESNGMLSQERDRALKEVERWKSEAERQKSLKNEYVNDLHESTDAEA